MKRPIALVTGGAKRIGAALARALAQQGWHVVIHYRSSAAEAAALALELAPHAATAEADLAKLADVDRLIDKARDAAGGPISLLVNSASLFEPDDIHSMTRASFAAHMETNLWAPLKLSQDFAHQAPKGGQIVNLLDQRLFRPSPDYLSYATSKAALLALTTTLAQALGPQGVRVNAIAPGPTLANARQTSADFAAEAGATVLGRGASPDDIAAALLYLAGADAVTGETISVDGGQRLQWRLPSRDYYGGVVE
jgi:NAD(P)-dependent dehydrogenase (short-subunit alcohol dehydrogenase family)